MIDLMIITDGRDCFWEMIRSFSSRVGFDDFSSIVVVDDSLSWTFSEQVSAWLPEAVLLSATEKRGFDGAVRAGWDYLKYSSNEFVFHLEDDFLFKRPVDVMDLAVFLRRHSDVCQVSLLRGPANDQETVAGGVIQVDPDSYEQKGDDLHSWIEHRKYFTTNPSLYRKSLLGRGWPVGANSEGRFSVDLFTDPFLKAAIWGQGEEWVEHIGIRSGIGY